MAQKRQRSKQRQAERRAQRLAEREGDGNSDARAERIERDRDPERQELEERVDLQVGAPPEDVGHSEFTARHAPETDLDVEDEELEVDDGDGAGAPPRTRGPRGVRGGGGGGDAAAAAAPGASTEGQRGRLWHFLKAVWAELQRVQWPNRKQTTQLTGVVLVFVVLVGAYLGGLDAIFSKLIQSIL